MGVSGLRSPDEWMGIPTRHLMATDSLVNVAALHESPGVREEKVGVAMLCGCAGVDTAPWFPNVTRADHLQWQILHRAP